MNRILLAMFACLCLASSLFAGEPVEGLWKPKRKKLIDMSWSNPAVTYLKDNLERMEQETPLDGVTIRLTGKRMGEDGKEAPVYSHAPWTTVAWKWEEFADDFAILKSLKFKKFTDNFLYTTSTPGDVDWFDDANWEAIANNFGILARISKEAGLTGLVIDPEEYGKHFWSKYPGHSHDEAVTAARRRGQQVGNAIFKEQPDAKLLCLFLFSFGTYLKGDAWASTMSHSFFNGIYDVLPPEATMIEGHEYFGYFAKSKADFERLLRDMDRTFMARVAAKNINKYRTQTQLAAPLYPDSWFFEDNVVYKFLLPEVKDTPKLDFARQQVTWALEVSDEYVWIYSELGCWWSKSSHPRVKQTWEEVCPGLNAVINSIHNPAAYTPEGAVNLLQIPPLDAEPGEWLFWTAVKDDGKGGWKDGIVWLEGVQRNGCVHQSVACEGGKSYLLRVKARPRTPISGTMSLNVAFRDKESKWMPEKKSVPLDVDTNGLWQTLVLQIEAPEGAGRIYLMMNVANLKEGEVAEFKEPELFEL